MNKKEIFGLVYIILGIIFLLISILFKYKMLDIFFKVLYPYFDKIFWCTAWPLIGLGIGFMWSWNKERTCRHYILYSAFICLIASLAAFSFTINKSGVEFYSKSAFIGLVVGFFGGVDKLIDYLKKK